MYYVCYDYSEVFPMSTISDANDLIAIVKIVKQILERYIFCKNTKKMLNDGYKETITLNKFYYPFEVEKSFVFQIYIMDMFVFLVNELVVCKIPFHIDALFKFSILLLESILILDGFDKIYKTNLLFLYEKRKHIKTPNIIIVTHFLLYLFSMLLITLPIAYKYKIGLFLIVAAVLYLVITLYTLKKQKLVDRQAICKTSFVKYCNIYLKNIQNKIYRIDMSASNILIKNNDDIYVYIQEAIEKEYVLKIYNVDIELIRKSVVIEKNKIDYIEIGKKKIRYSNGMWTMQN